MARFKREDIEDFSNIELREIKQILWSNKIADLPDKIVAFIDGDVVRKQRVISLINTEIVLRFDIGDLN